MAKRLFYSDEFEQLWRAYNPPTASSKKVAYESYQRAGKADILPPHLILLQAIAAYNRWLVANSKPGREYPKAHMATWINQERWEGFIAEAEAANAKEIERAESKAHSEDANRSSWPPNIIAALHLTEAVINTWFLPCTLIMGAPPMIICPTRFHADWLAQRFRSQIERVLGPVEITHD